MKVETLYKDGGLLLGDIQSVRDESLSRGETVVGYIGDGMNDCEALIQVCRVKWG